MIKQFGLVSFTCKNISLERVLINVVRVHYWVCSHSTTLIQEDLEKSLKGDKVF